MARVKVWLDGETLTASDLNAEFDNALASSLTPDTLDDVSGNLVEMQAVTDPYPAGAASLATTMRGEIQRLRYLLKQITGESEWYIDPDTTLSAIAAEDYVHAALFDANTILAANADDTPAAVTIAENRIVGRKTGGNITALTISEILDFIASAADGDMLIRSSGSWTRLAKGTASQVLQMNSGATIPEWATKIFLTDGDKGDITVSSSGTAWAIDSAVVSQSILKTSAGSVSYTVSAAAGTYSSLKTLPGGQYGFYPRTQLESSNNDSSSQTVTGEAKIFYNSTYIAPGRTLDTGIANNIYFTITHHSNSVTSTLTAYQRYVTSSGEIHWIFVLRNKTTKDIISVWESPDHPCMGNGGDPLIVSHPFPDYDRNTQEIIVINPSKEEVAKINASAAGGFIKSFLNLYDIDENSKADWPDIAVTVGLPEGHDWSTMIGKVVSPLKEVIPQPEYITVKSLRDK